VIRYCVFGSAGNNKPPAKGCHRPLIWNMDRIKNVFRSSVTYPITEELPGCVYIASCKSLQVSKNSHGPFMRTGANVSRCGACYGLQYDRYMLTA